MAIYILKVTTNKEDRALELVVDRAKKKNLNIYSITKPHGLKGYIIAEAEDKETVEDAAFNLPYIKGILGKTVSYEEVRSMLEPKVEDFKIEIGDIVEMIGQTFKGEKAKVTRINKQKGDVVVSLLGASVPIPVTVPMDNVKVIRRESEEEDTDQPEERDHEGSEVGPLG
jgi:transcription termination/antitermination protein NusG